MCFTIEIHKSRTEIESRFNKKFESGSENFEPKYYVSAFEFPKLPVITQEKFEIISMINWGLIPSWLTENSKIDDFRKNTLNAKAETLYDKPSFQNPIKNKRCLVIAHGFFEWQHNRKIKVPYYIKLKNDDLFSFAGIYDEWADKNSGEIFNGFSIITCEANTLLAKIHNSKKRMPVIIDKKNERNWIDPSLNENQITELLKPYNENELTAWPIGNLINERNQNKNVPELLERRDYSDYNNEINFLT